MHVRSLASHTLFRIQALSGSMRKKEDSREIETRRDTSFMA